MIKSEHQAFKDFNWHYANHRMPNTWPSRCWDNKTKAPMCQIGKKLLEQWMASYKYQVHIGNIVPYGTK